MSASEWIKGLRPLNRDISTMKDPAWELRHYFVPGPRSSQPRDKLSFPHGPEYDEACRKAWRKRLSQDSNAYHHAPDTIKSDPDVVIAAYFGALQRTWVSLERANEQLAQDRILVTEAVEGDWWELNDAGLGLRDDREYVFEITQEDVTIKWTYSVAAGNKAETKLVAALHKLQQELQQLKHISTRTRWDREDRLRALEVNLENLKHECKDLQLDQKLLLAKRHWDKLLKMREQLVEDRCILFNAVNKFGPILHKCVALLRTDRKILLKAVQRFWSSEEAGAQIGDEKRQVVLDIVSKDWQILDSLTTNLSKNQELMLNAVKRDWQVLEDAAAVIRADGELIHEAMIAWSSPSRRRAPTNEEITSALTAEHTVQHEKFEEAFKMGVLKRRARERRSNSVAASETGSTFSTKSRLSRASSAPAARSRKTVAFEAL